MVIDLLVCGGSQPKNSYFVSSSWVGAKFPLCANLVNADLCNFMNIQQEQGHTSMVPNSTYVWSISSAKIWMRLFTTPFLLAIFNSLTVHLGIWDRNCIPSCSIVARIEASWGKEAKRREQEGNSGKGVHQLPCPGAWDSRGQHAWGSAGFAGGH